MGVIIRLLDAEGNQVIDSISGDYEDSFSLETFEDLCQVHFDLDPKNTKGFIIARVKTLDPKQPEMNFYSYYSAYQLNKQLFQTQIYLKKRYIHRLHVLNPLTNSDIIGTVDYFLVKPPVVSDVVVVNIDTNAVVPAIADAPVVIEFAPRESELRETKSAARRVSLVYTQASNQIPQIQQTVEKNGGSSNNITTHKVALENPEPKRNIPEILRKHSESIKVNRVKREPAESPIVNNIGKTASTKPSGLKITTQMPTGSLSIHDSGCASAAIGQVTRFTIPVPKEELEALVPKTKSGNRRSLSYQNAVSATGQPVSFLEWTKMISEENSKQKKLTNAVKDESTSKDFDKVEFNTKSIVMTPIGISPRKRIGSISTPFSALPRLEEEKETESQEENLEGNANASSQKNSIVKTSAEKVNDTKSAKTEQPAEDQADAEEEEEPMEDPLVIFDAVLFANDNDFLEQSKTRQLFRSNATSHADAKLFEMKEYTGQSDENDFEILDESFLCDGCYPTDEALAAMNPFKRFFLMHKCILLAIFISLFIIGLVLLMVFKK
jgi:hypothetical protein